ncbi:MAG: solute-binding protein [Actinobacteria bacterium]|nr:solute-binding protein [Actinomycetota bacterium]
MKQIPRFITLLVCLVLLVGCSDQEPQAIRLATTTSTESSGLLDVLVPAFWAKTGINVQVMPMGTGKALRTARDGNCDLVLVHAPAAEQQFVDEGWGVNRRQVMYNDFVILGPASDPAQVRAIASAAEALKRIAASGSIFVSRGDNSGTHKKEQELWQATGLEPAGQWYRSVGKGMGEALIMANQMNAYVLSDRGTFIKFRKKIDLVVLVAGDKMLYNPYGVIAVNPAKYPQVKYVQALKFIEFLTSEQGQKLIADYRLDGEILFHPWPKSSE